MIQARQMLVKESQQKTKCPNQMDAKYITIHNTANDASANNEVQYMINNTIQVSYHYAVDDKEVVQGVPTNRNAWHCGDGSAANSGNRTSIGIEICYSKSGGERYKKAEALAIKFVAQLLHERNWGVDRVKKHQDWSGKYCPHRILEEGRWQSVLNAIQAELNALKNKKEVMQAVKNNKCKITYKGKTVEGIVINGVSYAPVRELAQLQGLQVGWEQQTSTVTLK